MTTDRVRVTAHTLPSLLRRSGGLGGLALAAGLTLAACAAPAGSGEQSERAVLADAPATAAPDAHDGGPDAEIAPEPAGQPTPVGGRPWDDAVSRACAVVLADAALAEVAQVADGDGTTSVWSAGRRWAACDVAEPTAGEPLVVRGRARDRFEPDDLALATARHGARTRVLAAGRLPWPVDSVSYRFPGGHDLRARFVTSDVDPAETWWVLAESVDRLDGTTTGEVTVEVVGATAEAYRIPWQQAPQD